MTDVKSLDSWFQYSYILYSYIQNSLWLRGNLDSKKNITKRYEKGV